MPSIIKIKNSTGSALPTGLTFGEPAFVQGTGLTANRLYVANSSGNAIWVGAEIPSPTTGTWTDNAAKTTLATQYAIDQRITTQLSASGVSSFNGLTGAVTGVGSAGAGTGIFVSGTTGAVTITNIGVQSFNGNTGAVSGLTSGGPLGTPASGTLTNCTGLPVSTGISGLSAGIAAFLGNPTSANLATAVTNETGSGFLVFATSPTLTTPVISTITNTGTITLPTLTSTLATLALSETLSNKTLSGVSLGTPASGTLTNCTGLPVSGISNLGANVGAFLVTPSAANLISAVTEDTGTAGSLVFSVSPTFTGTVNTSNLIVGGDLTVSGTTTTINSTTLTVNDFNIIVGATLSGTGALGAAIATGAGIAVGTGTGISFAYEHSTTSWLSTVDLNLISGKVYKIAGTSVLSATTLGSGVTSSSLQSLGTVTTFIIDAGTF